MSQSNVELKYAQNNVNHNYQLIAVSALFKTKIKRFNMLRVQKKKRERKSEESKRS